MQAQKYFRLFDLPQELQDDIFDDAFQQPDRLRIVSKSQWTTDENRQRRRVGSAYVPRPFPESKVTEWLISHRFFLAAARSWFGSKDLDMSYAGSRVGHNCREFSMPGQGLYKEFVVTATLDVHSQRPGDANMVKVLASCPRLRWLTLHVEDGFFEVLEKQHNRLAWEVELEDGDLDTVFHDMKMDGLCNLQGLVLLSRFGLYARTTRPPGREASRAVRPREAAQHSTSNTCAYPSWLRTSVQWF